MSLLTDIALVLLTAPRSDGYPNGDMTIVACSRVIVETRPDQLGQPVAIIGFLVSISNVIS